MYSTDCDEQFSKLRDEDEEAAEHLAALVSRAYREGLLPAENSSSPAARTYPTHRCPVGDQVQHLPGSRFSEDAEDQLDMPWTGELYVEGSDQSMLYRLYFIELRKQWNPPTERIVGSGIGRKPKATSPTWTPAVQTQDIHDAMCSGVTYCINVGQRWRRWDEN
ncbi:hypothetical protein [Nocardia sp. MW-W600-9]